VERLVSVVSPGAYCVSDAVGDIDGSPGQGLFFGDVRHLSGLWLRIGGARLVPLASWVRGSEGEFAAAAGVGPEGAQVVRRRFLGGGMREEISISNESGVAVDVRVELECAADFKDILELRGFGRAAERGEVVEEVGEGSLRFVYRRDGFLRGTLVRVDGVEAAARRGLLSFEVRLEAEETRDVRVLVEIEEGGEKVGLPESAPLYGVAPRLEAGWEALRRSWERSVEDLGSLAFDAGEGLLVPAAGAPWFMALFGRDALITGYQTIMLGPETAMNVLRALARHQAVRRDDFTDAEPGKIPHELRRGELAFFREIPEIPYYGTADATPLFLILLSEVWRWTADERLVRELEGAARRALGWILDHADRTGGYVAYAPRSSAGLANQGWKDSEDSMLFRDGTRAAPPIAPCEVQGYVYDALLRTAELAWRVWSDAALAVKLEAEAAGLKERFEVDFWMEDRRYYALAIDGAGRKVDSITSNAGHLLWSGVVSEERARLVADGLMEERLFCGWGIRTMAAGEGGYDPDSYHNGSVWPHDNSLIVQGLRRYGFRDEANRVAAALLDAAPRFEYRLPEVFAGYARDERNGPVEYPLSCSPQAWAAGTVALLVRAMLGVEPDVEGRRLLADPVLPNGVEDLRLEGVPAFGGRHTLRARDVY
jgi:glycogen debranching enzyme